MMRTSRLLTICFLAAFSIGAAPVTSIAQGSSDLGSASTSAEETPRVIVLLHGATPRPSDKASPGIPEPDSGTLDFTRFYFSYDFLRRLMGVSRTTGLKTLSGFDLKDGNYDNHHPANADGKVKYKNGADESKLNDHFIVPGNHTGDGTPRICVMVCYRDASLSLMTQSKSAVNQIHDLYSRRFGTAASPAGGKTLPNIIVVGHSMGGLVARTIMSAPTESIQGQAFTAPERGRAEAIRNRTLYLISLATPHEGSPIADRARKITDAVDSMDVTIRTVLNTLSAGLFDGLRRMIKNSTGNQSYRDLQRSLWSQLNSGALAPQRAERGDGTLIPVYTLIGHTPGGKFYDNPDEFPGGGTTSSSFSGDNYRETFRSVGLMFFDYMLHNLGGDGPKSWGSTDDRLFDKVARYHKKALGLTLSAPGEDQGMPFGFPKFFSRRHITKVERPLFGDPKTVVVRTNRDREVDADGLVSVKSGHGVNLGTSTRFFFDHTGQWNTPSGREVGSWYRLPSDGNPWEFLNHETIHRSADVGGWLRTNIISQAGPITSTGDVSVWLPPTVSIKTPVAGSRISAADLAAARLKATVLSIKKAPDSDN